MLPFAGNSQEFDDFGKPTKEELEMKVCSFDSNAVAVILKHEAVSRPGVLSALVTKYHVRMKILKDEGISYGNVSLPYYRGVETIVAINVLCINTNQNGDTSSIRLENKSIFTHAISNGRSEKTFAAPDVRVGTIFEYEYVVFSSSYDLDDWLFQSSLPTARSKFHLTIFQNTEFTYQIKKAENYFVDVQQDTKKGTICFEMKNVPGLEDEPYMDSPRDYLQHVRFQISGVMRGGKVKKTIASTWKELNRWLLDHESFGDQLKKNLPGAKQLVQQVREFPSDQEKIQMGIQFIRQTFDWNGSNGLFSSEGVKAATKQRTGNSADINLALVNLFRSFGLEAYPMLVSERSHGKVDTTYPFLEQFNKIVAFVVTGSRTYYIDGTDKITPPNITPEGLLNTFGFVVDRYNTRMIHIQDSLNTFLNRIAIAGILNEDGILMGNLHVNSNGYAKIRTLERLSSDSSQYIRNYLATNNIEVDSFSISNKNVDSLPLKQTARFSMPVQSTGEYLFVPVNLFTGFESTPFMSDTRASDINFGFRRTIVSQFSITVPKGYKPDQLPKGINVINPERTISFIRQLQYSENSSMIIGRIRIDFNQTLFYKEDYEIIRQFFKQMVDLLNEPVVLKKVEPN
jgi:hypothetical protein